MKPRHSWTLALTTFTFVAVVGVTLGVQQFLVKFLHDQAAHTRTLWGLCFMLLAVAGPMLLLFLWRKRAEFANFPATKQWTIALVIPALYLSALGVLMFASTFTKFVLIGRHGLSVLVRVNCHPPDRFMTVEMHGLRRELPSTQTDTEDGPEHRFEFVGYESYLRYPRDVTLSAKGAARIVDDGKVEMSLHFDATESFRLHFAGLAEAKVMEGDQFVSDDFQFRPGRHQLSVTGRTR